MTLAAACEVLDPLLADVSVLKIFHDAKRALEVYAAPGSQRRRRWMM